MGEKTLIKGSFLWDGICENLIPECRIIIENKIIKSVNKTSDIGLEPSSYDKVLDFSGLTLLPGLIDCHTHHSMDASLENFLGRMNDCLPILTVRAKDMLKKDILSGVTTCRTLGDKEYLDVACREGVNIGILEGPRSIVAGKGIRAANGHGYVGYPFSGPEEIKNAVMENLKAGVDFIKIFITATLKGEGDLPSYLTREEIEAAITTAHKAGVAVASHCVGGIGLDWALALGLDTLEHAYYISDKQIEKLIKSKTSLILTLSPIFNDEIVNNYPIHLIQGHYNERNQISGRLKALIGKHIPFALGTDGMHGELANEAELAVKIGASNLEALMAATINGAKVCRIEDETGSISPGKLADIIAVEGNPLENIETLRNVRAVIKQGKLISEIVK
jgi:imidazolonepropionase-like amidohydrolase